METTKKQTKDHTKEAIAELAKEAKLETLDQYKPKITLPKKGKLITTFAEEIINHIKNENDLFYRTDSRSIIEIGKVKLSDDNEEFTGFLTIKPNRFITLLEKYITPGIYDLEKDEDTKEDIWVFKEKSITGDLGNTLLQSHIIEDGLPKIKRIFTVPIPIIHDGKLTFPTKGYDPRFNSWLPYDAPEISKPNMELKEAKEILYKLLKEFVFQDHEDYINAIAALLTPFLRGLFESFNIRTPLFVYIANRERAGKDYLAGISGVIYEGYALEEPPINSGEKGNSSNDELKKKVLSAMIAGRKRLHFANNKGFLNNVILEAILTARKYSDRVLGRNEILTFDNELDFSLSGNIGIGFTPDLANRARFIRLFLDIEDANIRKFENPNLHKWVEDNRDLILSALYSLVKNWIEKGAVPGNVLFTSFPQWAEICGGIMEAAEYDNPCKPDKETLAIGGDNETQDMKSLYELGYERFADEWINKKQIVNLLLSEEIFSYLDFNEKRDQTKFGMKLKKFLGRVLSDIRLTVQDTSIRSSRYKYKFTKEKVEKDKSIIFGENYKKDGNHGNDGNFTPPSSRKSNNIYNNNNMVSSGEKVSQVTKVPKKISFSDEMIGKSGLDPNLIKKIVKEVNEEQNDRTNKKTEE